MKRIRIGVVGLSFGSWMIEHEILSASAAPYVEIAAVCDVQEQKAQEWGAKLQVPYYQRLEDLLLDSSIEAIALFSGPNGRADLIEQIILAGKHVMTTKPFENNSLNAQNILQKAQSLHKVIHLNSPSPMLNNDLLQAQRWIDSYELGRPIAFRAETTCSYREKANGTWYDDPELCPVAPIFRLGIYMINDLVRFFGEVDKVNVLQSRIFTERPTADNAQLNILFKNGSIGNIFASFCIDDQQYYKTAFVMNFERGTIYRNIGPRSNDPAVKNNLLQVVAVQNGKQIIESFQTRAAEGYQWDVFYKTVRGERLEDPSYADDIVAGIRLIELMKEQQ